MLLFSVRYNCQLIQLIQFQVLVACAMIAQHLIPFFAFTGNQVEPLVKGKQLKKKSIFGNW